MSGLRTCVVGVGRLGGEHARILAGLPESRLVGVHDIDPARGREVAGQVGVPFEANLARLLEASDAAVVAVPTADHFAVARRVLEARCHVLVEKPLARGLAEADELIAAAERAGRCLAVGHVERFNPAVRACEPYLEDPRFVESLRLARFGPRGTDVTVILDLMIHDIDLVLGLMGGPVSSLHAVGVPVLSGSLDIANARLIFESGAVANVTASRVSVEPKRELRIFQATGYFRLDLAGGRAEFLRRRPGTVSGSSLADIVERVPLEVGGPEPLELELRAWLAAARGEASAIVDGKAARAALEVALRITREIEEFTHVAAEDS